MKKIKKQLALFLVLCALAGSISTFAAFAIEQSGNEIGESEELCPMRSISCYPSLDAGLNYYLGKYNWEYVDGNPSSDGFTITVSSNGMCHIQGDDVDIYFRYR